MSVLSTIPIQYYFQATKQTAEMISEKVRTLQEVLPIRALWLPVESILSLEVIPFLLQVVAYVFDYSVRYRYLFKIHQF